MYLTFLVLASSMKVEYPLTDALPSTKTAKIYQFRKDDAWSERRPIAKDEEHAVGVGLRST
jgi:hypothetical protein